MRNLCWIVVAILFSIFACTKIETIPFGGDLIPPIDGVTTLDTQLEVITNTFIDSSRDSLRVYKDDEHIIGVIKDDPVFGKTVAEAYFELKPTSYKYSFPGGASILPDSAVLILSYKGVYGDTTVPQKWEVRELADTLERDSAYPVSKHFEAVNVLGSKSIDITTLNDSVKDGFEDASYQIRIKLDAGFATRFIKQYDSTNAYAGDSSFRQYFKGFAVGPAEGSTGNALIRVSLVDTNTKLALFYNYKIPDSPNTSASVSYFRFSTGSSRDIGVSGSGNYIKRYYDGSKISNTVSDPATNDSLLYIQTSPGTFATVKIPGLDSLDNSIIHRAELTVYESPEAASVNPFFTPPRFLLLSSYDSAKRVKINVPNDFVASASSGINISTFGGYIVNKNGFKAYSFDVSRYVQGIVTRNDKNLTLRLSAPANDSLIYTDPYPATTSSSLYFTTTTANYMAVGRVVLKGGGLNVGDPLRMRLRIIYSRI